MHKRTFCFLIIITPFVLWLAHFFAFFIHEYSHSFSAWLLGVKSNPFAIYYGDTSLTNLLTYNQMHENVDYASFENTHPWYAVWIAFAGFGVGNVFLFFVSLWALYTKKTHGYLYYYFFYWLIVLNLANFIDYVPSRTFGTHGDMHTMTENLAISPWWLMVILGYPICYSFWYFYSNILSYTYFKLQLTQSMQAIILMATSFILFALFGTAGMHDYGSESQLISQLTLYMVPIVVIACWPSRHWVRHRLTTLKAEQPL